MTSDDKKVLITPELVSHVKDRVLKQEKVLRKFDTNLTRDEIVKKVKSIIDESLD